MLYQLDDYVLDDQTLELRKAGNLVPLRPQALAVLRRLARLNGRLVGKRDLLDTNWAGRAVSDNALAQCISDIRRVLGDGGKGGRIVETVYGRGFRVRGFQCLGQAAADPQPSEGPLGVLRVLPFESRCGVKEARAVRPRGPARAGGP